jgi:hypothetical protein
MDWDRFEKSIKTQSRFFNRTAASCLASVFGGIGDLQTRYGRPLVVDAGPGARFHMLYRARVFQSDADLEAALARPDVHLGAPPASLAAAGRMNAQGISVFYGASNQKTTIAELRPPVDARMAVAQFQIIRKLRILDLTAIGKVRLTENLGDLGLVGRAEHAVFLRSLIERISRPQMLDDKPDGYLVTQAVADFLATEAQASIDGIIFPSRQIVEDTFNVVLFHKSARVEPMDIPAGTGISVSTGRWEEEGWIDEFEVFEEVSRKRDQVGESQQKTEHPDLPVCTETAPIDPRDADWRDFSLRFVPESLEVHRVRGIEIETDRFPVRRDRRKA